METSSKIQPEPLPYHRALADYLQSHHAELWNGLASESWEQAHASAVLLELNKTSKPLTEDSAPELFESLSGVKVALEMESVTVTLWEVPEQEGFPDSAVFWVSDEAHLAVKRSFLGSLTEAERERLFGTLLTRWRLWDGWEGRFRIADRLLKHLLNNPRQDEAAIRESWKRWNEATDAFANWSEQKPPRETIGFTNGPLRWEHLDLLERQHVSEHTRQLIHRLLEPKWFQTPATLALARKFFPDLTREEFAARENEPPAKISLEDPELRDYVCYVLLDFISTDRELKERAFPECLKLARELSCESRLLELTAEELEWSEEEIDALAGETLIDRAEDQDE